MIYKNKFVALYDQEDNCVFIGDTWQEIAEYLEKKIDSIQSSFSHIFRKTENVERKHINFKGKKLTPYLFDTEE